MFLKRKVIYDLENWLKGNKALLVKGSRQVGKTYIINKFINDNFNDVSYVNFVTDQIAASSIACSSNYKDFLLRLSIIEGVNLKDGCVIFLDEIQEVYKFIRSNKSVSNSVDPITLVKDLVNLTNYRFVFSGSLLGIELYDVISNPMGYCTDINMYPLDFEEFLWANGINEEIVNRIKYCFNNKIAVEDFIHNRMMDLYHKYLLVGGMPEAVCAFIEKNSLKEVENVHRDLNNYILKDIAKYANENEKLKIKDIYNLLPSELNSHSKRFQLSDIEGIKRGDNTILSFAWLNDAGVAIPVYSTKEPKVPLRISEERNLLKLFHEDVGILTYLLFNYDAKNKILNGELNVNYGSIVENAVAMSLHAHGFENMYYYNNKKFGELDFVIERNANVVPIEIKSGKDYSRHLALNNILNVPNYSFEEAYVFYNGNYSKKGLVDYFPIYMVDFISKR